MKITTSATYRTPSHLEVSGHTHESIQAILKILMSPPLNFEVVDMSYAGFWSEKRCLTLRGPDKCFPHMVWMIVEEEVINGM